MKYFLWLSSFDLLYFLSNLDTKLLTPFFVAGYSVNGNGLLEFRVSPESGQAGQEYTVRGATLWLKADVKRQRSSKCKSTEIFVFKFISSINRSVKLSSQVNRVVTRPFCTSSHFVWWHVVGRWQWRRLLEGSPKLKEKLRRYFVWLLKSDIQIFTVIQLLRFSFRKSNDL